MWVAAALVSSRLLFAAEPPSLVPGIDLVWRAPPGCPDAAAITDMVGALLRGRSGAGRSASRVRARVTRVGERRWVLRLDLHARRGHTRRFAHADDCQVLARAAALLTAIHHDPLAVALGIDAPAPVDPAAPPAPGDAPPDALVVPPAPVDAPWPPAPAVADRPVVPPPNRTVAASPTVQLEPADPPTDDLASAPAPLPAPVTVAGHLRLEGGLDAGVLPGVGGQVGLFGGVTLARVRLELGLVGVPLRVAPAGPGRAAEGRFDRLAGAVRACPTWSRPAVAFALCIGAEAGGLHGVARQIERPSSRWVAWFGLSLGPALRWRVAGPLGLYFAVDAILALTRPRFTVNPERDLLFRAGRAGLRASIGLELRFEQRNR